MRPRDHQLERYLDDLAARAAGRFDGAGCGDDGGLGRFADQRAWPDGIRLDLDAVKEMREEIADARNYAVFGITPIYADVLAGDPAATALYQRLLGAHADIVNAWHKLR